MGIMNQNEGTPQVSSADPSSPEKHNGGIYDRPCLLLLVLILLSQQSGLELLSLLY